MIFPRGPLRPSWTGYPSSPYETVCSKLMGALVLGIQEKYKAVVALCPAAYQPSYP